MLGPPPEIWYDDIEEEKHYTEEEVNTFMERLLVFDLDNDSLGFVGVGPTFFTKRGDM